MHADELVRPLSGADWWNVAASGDVPALRVTDGPSGARGQRFVGGPPSVSFPCGAALGATWDVELVERVGAALAAETDAKGAQVLLGPTINLQRTPLGGRHFECFSEDPYLTAPGRRRVRAGPAGRWGGGVRQAPGGERPGARPLRDLRRARRAHAAGGVAPAVRAPPARRRLVDHGRLQPAPRHPLLRQRAAADDDPARRVGLGRRGDLRLVRRPQHRRARQRRARPRDAGPRAALGSEAGGGHRRRRGQRGRDRGQARAVGAPGPPDRRRGGSARGRGGGRGTGDGVDRSRSGGGLARAPAQRGRASARRLDRERGAARTQRGSRGDPGRRQRAGDAHRRRHDRRRAAGAAGRSARGRAGHRRQPRHARDAGRRPPAPRRIGGGRRGDPRRRRRGAQRAPPTRLPDPVPRRPRRGRGGGRAGRRGRPRRSPRA